MRDQLPYLASLLNSIYYHYDTDWPVDFPYTQVFE
jgi:hypothetical protein